VSSSVIVVGTASKTVCPSVAMACSFSLVNGG
jgi:hypothetical protein